MEEVTQGLVQQVFKHLQTLSVHIVSGQPVPVSEHTHGGKIKQPYIKSFLFL